MRYIKQPSTALFSAILVLVASLVGGCSDSTDSGSTSGNTSSTSGAPSTSSSTAFELTGTPAVAANPGVKYQFQPTVTQSAGKVTFSISGQPSWATFDSTTGQLAGTPSQSMVGMSADVTITASNGASTASIGPFTIVVTTATIAAGSIALSWEPPTDDAQTPLDELAGYYIYYGTSSDDLSQSVLVFGGGTSDYVIQGLTPGTYYFALTSYNAQGTQSERSSIVSVTI